VSLPNELVYRDNMRRARTERLVFYLLEHHVISPAMGARLCVMTSPGVLKLLEKCIRDELIFKEKKGAYRLNKDFGKIDAVIPLVGFTTRPDVIRVLVLGEGKIRVSWINVMESGEIKETEFGLFDREFNRVSIVKPEIEIVPFSMRKKSFWRGVFNFAFRRKEA